MSRHPLSAPHGPRGRFPFAVLRSLAAAGGLAALSGATPAAEPAAASAPGVTDVVLARSALAALDADAELKGVNLVVSVVNGVALVGGPVPSAAVGKRAEKVVRAVDGMKEVRNACFVSSGPDPLLKAVADRAGTVLPPRPVMGELPGVLTNQLSPPVSPFPPNTNVAAAGGNSTVVALKPSLPGPGAATILGAPVGPGGPGVPVTPSAAPGRLTGAADDVLAAAGAVRTSEARFANLTVEVRDGVVVVGGSAARASDAWDFAQKLRQVPGVSRVSVGVVPGK